MFCIPISNDQVYNSDNTMHQILCDIALLPLKTHLRVLNPVP